MKTNEGKKGEMKSRPAGRFSGTHNYYFHPGEDFKEDYDWKKTG